MNNECRCNILDHFPDVRKKVIAGFRKTVNHFVDINKMVKLNSESQLKIWKGRISCHEISDHFADIGKMVVLSSASLINSSICPDSLTPAEDVKKVELRLNSAEKKALKNPDGLD